MPTISHVQTRPSGSDAFAEHLAADVHTLADRLEVEIDFEVNHPESFIWLGNLTRHGAVPGSARQVLDKLCGYADDCDLSIKAAVIWWNTALLDYYAGFGFEICPDDHGDDHDEDYAIIQRQPKPD